MRDTVHDVGIDALDAADPAEIDGLGLAVFTGDFHQHLARPDEFAVLAADAGGLAAVVFDVGDDALVDLAGEHHLDHLHRGLVGYPETPDEPALDAEPFERAADLRTAAVDDDGMDPEMREHDDVLREAAREVGVEHGRAAVLDDQRAPREAFDVGQCFEQHLGFCDEFVHLGSRLARNGDHPAGRKIQSI